MRWTLEVGVYFEIMKIQIWYIEVFEYMAYDVIYIVQNRSI